MATEPADDEIAANAHGLYDATWDDERWRRMAEQLVADELVTWREITTTLLGELNPPQVGTSIASSDAVKFGFKDNHGTLNPGKSFMPFVLDWFYATTGRCVDCDTRLDLQADHVDGRENYADPREADLLTNMALRCRRHNVAKRKSHVARAGRTLLPAQQALMWILLEIKPVTRRDLERLCRIYGMTMASIRFDEAWAMAVWLDRDGHYRIARDTDSYDLLQWADGSMTRRFVTDAPAPRGAAVVAPNVAGDKRLCLLATSDGTKATLRYFDMPLAWIPFVYNLDDRPPTDIAIWPTQSGGTPLAPRGMTLHAWALRSPDETVTASIDGVPVNGPLETKTFKGMKIKGLPRTATPGDLALIVS